MQATRGVRKTRAWSSGFSLVVRGAKTKTRLKPELHALVFRELHSYGNPAVLSHCRTCYSLATRRLSHLRIPETECAVLLE